MQKFNELPLPIQDILHEHFIQDMADLFEDRAELEAVLEDSEMWRAWLGSNDVLL
jgi:hypothetical protein